MASMSFPLLSNIISCKSSPGRHESRFFAAITPSNALRTASFYQVLGIRPSATYKEIKSAYRKQAKELHPDAGDTSAGDEFIRLQAAYATLSNPEKRAVYDTSLFQLQRRRRTWETDQCW